MKPSSRTAIVPEAPAKLDLRPLNGRVEVTVRRRGAVFSLLSRKDPMEVVETCRRYFGVDDDE